MGNFVFNQEMLRKNWTLENIKKGKISISMQFLKNTKILFTIMRIMSIIQWTDCAGKGRRRREGRGDEAEKSRLFSRPLFFFLPFFLSFWAAVPKGSMTYAFKHMGKFLLLLLLLLLSFVPPSNPSLKAHIPVSSPKSQPQDPNASLKDLDLKARIWA